ncbi:MAG: hypothetical protein D4R79_14600 [Comamonadaceae bacterium]|nr:MAG: hypothetical protein D4R79_14600 [Comamonadaceae bacterium]
MPDSAPVIPDFDVVIPTHGVVIPDLSVILSAPGVVIPDLGVVLSAHGVVIPDSIRDPAPRRHWIAGQARNDKAWHVMTKRGT